MSGSWTWNAGNSRLGKLNADTMYSIRHRWDISKLGYGLARVRNGRRRIRSDWGFGYASRSVHSKGIQRLEIKQGEKGDAKLFSVARYGSIVPSLVDDSPSGLHERKLNQKWGVGDVSSFVSKQMEHLLPKDHKTSVGSTYVDYVKWSMAASICGSMGSILSTQSLLYAVGLGQGAIVGAAAINWVLKDGLGQLGGMLFASIVNQRFDAEPRRWRFISNFIIDISVLLEVLTPFFPGNFLLLASLANAGKNVGWISASATRAGIHRSFMKTENLSDITAKAASQSIASSVIGTALGIGLSPFIGESSVGIFTAAVSLSVLHLIFTYKSLSNVHIRTFNMQRLWLSVEPSLSAVDWSSCTNIKMDSTKIRCPVKVADLENFLHGGFHDVTNQGKVRIPRQDGNRSGNCHRLGIRIGTPLNEAFNSSDALLNSIERISDDKHILTVNTVEGRCKYFSKPSVCINLLLFSDATAHDTLKGILHVIIVYHALSRVVNKNGLSAVRDMDELRRLSEECREVLSKKAFSEFIRSFNELGWKTETLYLEPRPSRIRVLLS